MAKALKPIVVLLLLLCIGSLVLGIQLFGKREVLKGRVQKTEQALGDIARNLHFEEFNGIPAVEMVEDLDRMDAPLKQLAAFAQVQYDDLQNTRLDLENTRQELSATKDELARTRSDLDREKARTEELTATVAAKNTEIAQLESRVSGLEDEKVALNLKIEELNTQLVEKDDELRDTQDKVATLEQTITQLEAELSPGTKSLPKGLTGHILYVNTDWNFVVINLGSQDGLVPEAEMLIHRADALIGKVVISGISQNMAIADIQSDWAQNIPKEGDFVVF